MLRFSFWKHGIRAERPTRRNPGCRRRFRRTIERLEDRLTMSADAVLDWNAVMLQANAVDHALASPDQGGPTRTTRAFAIVSAAMFDAVNSITRTDEPYLISLPGYKNADQRAAVSVAAYRTLAAMYPHQANTFQVQLARSLGEIVRDGSRIGSVLRGIDLGFRTAQGILAAHAGDGSDATAVYQTSTEPGHHQPDPYHPDQGYLTPNWGKVTPFVIPDAERFQADPPPALTSEEYTQAYNQVKELGSKESSTRTAEQTEIGVFWAYDGSPGLGTPPRFYNQIVRVIAQDQGNTMQENARLFALVNLAMADAGIQSWHDKYQYDFWRPIIAIREGDLDGNDNTAQDATWTPLGAQYTNGTGVNFTPPFPAYTSGHATLGAAALQTVANFYGKDNIPFEIMSDEFNGINKGVDGQVRPVVVRRFDSLSQAIQENAASRIYLGIHWAFDATQGIESGTQIADYVTAHALQPHRQRASEPPRHVASEDSLPSPLAAAAAWSFAVTGPTGLTAGPAKPAGHAHDVVLAAWTPFQDAAFAGQR